MVHLWTNPAAELRFSARSDSLCGCRLQSPGCKFDYISRREGIIIVPAHAPFPL